MPNGFNRLLKEIRSCAVCQEDLPHKVRTVLRASPSARILIIGQAPGTKVHESGIPWNDASGNRLRSWLDMDADTFYDESKIAIIPMGFCYPGKGKSGDLPPRAECAPLWHDQLLKRLARIQLTLLIGLYAQKYYLTSCKSTLTETVKAYKSYGPRYIPLPHPSPRNIHWFNTHRWFEQSVIPYLRGKVKRILK